MSFNVQVENQHDHHKPWLVMVNGLFASLQSWNQSVECLCPHFRVLRYDGRGQGEGPRPLSGYGLSELVQDLKTIMDENGIETAHFIGLSNGARVALQFAALYPARVSSVAASDTYAHVSPLLKLKLSSWLEANRKGGPSLRFEVATPWIWGESIVREKPELLEFYRQRAGLEKVHVIEGLIKGAMEDQDIDLKKIVCPVLLTVGAEDLLTPPFIHEQIQQQLPNGAMRIVKGGHASLLENPESVQEVILPWLCSLVNQSVAQEQELASQGVE
jgi:3-oxoadipate enol-lactonase